MIKISPNKKAPTAIICESLPETNGIGITAEIPTLIWFEMTHNEKVLRCNME